MKKYLQHLLYVLKHKWFVFIKCCKLGIPILGILHDLSRFKPNEFIPYAKSSIYNKDNKPSEITKQFTYAWNEHQHANKHHFEYWIHHDYHTHEKTILPMPDKYRRELLADWTGAAKAKGSKNTPKEWYLENKNDLQFHPETRMWIEKQLGIENE